MNLKSVLVAAVLIVSLMAITSLMQRVNTRASFGGEDPRPSVPFTTALVVRPDTVEVAFAFETGSLDKKAQEGIRQAAAEIAQQVKAEAGVEGTWRWRDIAECEKMPGNCWHLSAILEIGLPADMDFWTRAATLASLTRTTAAAEKSMRARKPAVYIWVSEPEVLVRDPEKYRAALLKRWADRVRALAVETKDSTSQSRPFLCSPIGSITQNRLSLEEIELRLGLDCGQAGSE